MINNTLTKEQIQSNWDDLFNIIEFLKLKPNLHYQNIYHHYNDEDILEHPCGTSHCIAGWLELINLYRNKISTNLNNYFIYNGIDYDYNPIIKELFSENPDYESTWNYAAYLLDLDFGEESSFIFAPELTIYEIEESAIDLAKQKKIKINKNVENLMEELNYVK